MQWLEWQQWLEALQDGRNPNCESSTNPGADRGHKGPFFRCCRHPTMLKYPKHGLRKKVGEWRTNWCCNKIQLLSQKCCWTLLLFTFKHRHNSFKKTAKGISGRWLGIKKQPAPPGFHQKGEIAVNRQWEASPLCSQMIFLEKKMNKKLRFLRLP